MTRPVWLIESGVYGPEGGERGYRDRRAPAGRGRLLLHLTGTHPEERVFHLDPAADFNGTHRVGTVLLAPAFLVERFGPPLEADGYKVSGQYVFGDGTGAVFTLYDWKETTLYHGGDSDCPTPQQFWEDPSPGVFHIGGRGEDIATGRNPTAGAFREWLLAEYRAWDAQQRR
jgi:hypothetical protein